MDKKQLQKLKTINFSFSLIPVLNIDSLYSTVINFNVILALKQNSEWIRTQAFEGQKNRYNSIQSSLKNQIKKV
jgi:hypothetical protein